MNKFYMVEVGQDFYTGKAVRNAHRAHGVHVGCGRANLDSMVASMGFKSKASARQLAEYFKGKGWDWCKDAHVVEVEAVERPVSYNFMTGRLSTRWEVVSVEAI